jgi:PKD domain
MRHDEPIELLASRARRVGVAVALTFALSLIVAVSGAQAVVVDLFPGSSGQASVTYPTDYGNYAGVALVPGTRGDLQAAAHIPIVKPSACTDPALTADLGGPFLPLTGPVTPLCYQGGPVIHQNETFAFTWDPVRRYWATTRNYVQKFLADVGAGSGTFGSPYAVTPQYTDGSGRAANASVFGGGCIDFGVGGGASCKFGSTTGTSAGHDYPASGCPFPASNQWNVWFATPNGPLTTGPNDTCLTDAQIQGEVAAMVTQNGVIGRLASGYTPLVVVLTPPGVEVCLDSGGTLCSANTQTHTALPASPVQARFCSYHAQMNVAGHQIAYVVQPWTASWNFELGCDDPSVPDIPNPVPVDQLALDVGARLVSPLSQGELAAITNPALNAWFGLDGYHNALTTLNGSEINDNGCGPLGKPLDMETINGTPYPVQREFNNAGAIETDPNALPCSGVVNLQPTFVAPNSVNPGDVIDLDGSTTPSTLLVPRGNYVWDFGDGTSSIGPSVEHSYGKSGTYNVKLTVTDRGGNVATGTEQVQVLGPGGGGTPPPPVVVKGHLKAHLQLTPQGLRAVLRSGVALRVSSTEPANGIVTLSISRSAAKKAHIRTGRGLTVVIGRGTTSAVKAGTVSLHLRLSRSVAAKLRRLRHVKLTIRIQLVAANGDRGSWVAAALY